MMITAIAKELWTCSFSQSGCRKEINRCYEADLKDCILLPVLLTLTSLNLFSNVV